MLGLGGCVNFQVSCLLLLCPFCRFVFESSCQATLQLHCPSLMLNPNLKRHLPAFQEANRLLLWVTYFLVVHQLN
jgi:hypothetical protein